MSSSSATASSSSGSNASGGGGGYSMIQLQSGSRPYSPTGGARERGGRDDQIRERDLRDSDVCGGGGRKKNPLSIGSIISDDGQ